MRLPYSMRVKLKQAKRLRRAAARAERGLWRDGRLTQDQEQVVYDAARRIRGEAEQAEREAFCR